MSKINKLIMTMPIEHMPRYIEEMINMFGLKLESNYDKENIMSEVIAEKFIEYMLECENHLIFYFGSTSLFGKNEDKFKDFACIDGIKRITTIMKFFNDEIKVLGKSYSEMDKNIKFKTKITLNVRELEIQDYIRLSKELNNIN